MNVISEKCESPLKKDKYGVCCSSWRIIKETCTLHEHFPHGHAPGRWIPYNHAHNPHEHKPH